jgi:ZIP family zinc transporter
MGASLFWGAISASSLLIGAVLGVMRPWNAKALGLVLGFGAGALISGISFQLAAGGFEAAGPWPLTIGLAAGALVFFFADRAVEQWAIKAGGMAGLSLALGGLLDGIPEQAVLGIDLSHGNGVSLALLMAIFVSNLPESIGSSTQMHEGGRVRATSCCSGSPWPWYAWCRPGPGTSPRLSRRAGSRASWTGSLPARFSSCWSER